MPLSVRTFATSSARDRDSASFAAALPRLSVWPVTTIVAFGYERRMTPIFSICACDRGVSLADPLTNSTRSRSAFIDLLAGDARYVERRSSTLPAGNVKPGLVGTAHDAGGGVTVPVVPTAALGAARRATSRCLAPSIPHQSTPPTASAASRAAR